MKPFSAKHKPVSRARARNAAFINQLATPGLGSLLCGRWVAGAGQLALALTGFTVWVDWFVKEMGAYYGMMFNDQPPVQPGLKVLATGVIIFAASWLWSGATSISLMREATKETADTFKTFSAPAQKLEAARVEERLVALPDWQRNGDAISRTYQFKDFPAAIHFVTLAAGLAERAWHHPDIDIRWNKVTLTLSTHDAGGLTEKDFALAAQFEALSRG